MRTRAQASRDAALRRLTWVNNSLAVAAVLGVGVVTDVVAHTAYGHTVTASTSATGTGGVELLTAGHIPAASPHRSSVRRTSVARHHSSTAVSGSSGGNSSASSTAAAGQTSSSGSSASSASSVQPAVVAVSGGS